jgi:hypothetical protein
MRCYAHDQSIKVTQLSKQTVCQGGRPTSDKNELFDYIDICIFKNWYAVLMQSWPSGLRRYVQVVLSSDA